MNRSEYAVAIVVDPNFGERRLKELAERLHVWVDDTPASRSVADQIKAYHYREPGVTTLRGLAYSPDRSCAGHLKGIMEEVASDDLAPSTVEVYGTGLSPRLRKVFLAEGFTTFTTNEGGFTARSRLVPLSRTVPRPLGLALSGGGFRATAFHLGVLKRLRELGMLEKVDIVSTVSGGSIAGAHWVYWQARRGNTISEASEWDEFESSLIRFMLRGAREWVLLRAFWLPFAALLILAAAVTPFSWRLWSGWPSGGQAALAVSVIAVIGGIAYTFWHYLAAALFQRLLDRALFKGTTLYDLSTKEMGSAVKWPQLIVNATGLNSGDHLLFAPEPGYGTPGGELLRRVLPSPGVPPPRRKRRRTQPRNTPPRVTLALNTPLARAVTASCALPGVFAPLKIPDPLPGWEAPSWGPGRFLAVDGGVKDNQGTQVLLDGCCRGAIVSDAAAALRTIPSPWTWQMFPPRRGVIFRSQDIIYERMRDLGYQRLEERYDFSRRLSEAGLREEAEAVGTPLLDGYTYVELWPSDDFRWSRAVRLPDSLVRFVASIRTDLDRFSEIEISALMFHGYTVIDHCIRAYQPHWLPEPPPELRFSSPVKEICINWPELSTPELVRCLSHLAMSDSRVKWYRSLRRLWISRKAQRGIAKAFRAEASDSKL